MDKARAYARRISQKWPNLKAKVELDQHFLVSDTAIARELNALDLQSSDRVAELGAGIGSVAQALPPTATTTLVELDPELCAILHQSFRTNESVHIVEGDALAWMRTHRANALICNLPWELDRSFFLTLQSLAEQQRAPRVAVAVVNPKFDVAGLCSTCKHYGIEDLGLIERNDFWPTQELPSRLLVAHLEKRP